MREHYPLRTSPSEPPGSNARRLFAAFCAATMFRGSRGGAGLQQEFFAVVDGGLIVTLTLSAGAIAFAALALRPEHKGRRS